MRCVIALANRGAGLCMSTMRPTPVFLLRYWSAEEPINVGTGEDIGIAELAETIARVVGFKGRFAFDLSRPDGAPRKALDASKLLALGWRAQIGFDQGICETYDWFRKEIGVAVP